MPPYFHLTFSSAGYYAPQRCILVLQLIILTLPFIVNTPLKITGGFIRSAPSLNKYTVISAKITPVYTDANR